MDRRPFSAWNETNRLSIKSMVNKWRRIHRGKLYGFLCLYSILLLLEVDVRLVSSEIMAKKKRKEMTIVAWKLKHINYHQRIYNQYNDSTRDATKKKEKSMISALALVQCIHPNCEHLIFISNEIRIAIFIINDYFTFFFFGNLFAFLIHCVVTFTPFAS